MTNRSRTPDLVVGAPPRSPQQPTYEERYEADLKEPLPVEQAYALAGARMFLQAGNALLHPSLGVYPTVTTVQEPVEDKPGYDTRRLEISRPFYIADGRWWRRQVLPPGMVQIVEESRLKTVQPTGAAVKSPWWRLRRSEIAKPLFQRVDGAITLRHEAFGESDARNLSLNTMHACPVREAEFFHKGVEQIALAYRIMREASKAIPTREISVGSPRGGASMRAYISEL